MHDAQGNVLSTYQVVQTRNNNKIVESVVQERVYMYGSSRLGELQTGNTVVRGGTFPYQATKPYDGKGAYNRSGGFLLRAQPGSSPKLEWYTGLKNYELTNHLGNVVSTITDRKKGSVGTIGVSITFGTPFGGTFSLPTTLEAVLHWIPEVTSATDYYPFGSQMPGRSFSSDNYRYGFNGMEKDDEVKGGGNSLDFGARIFDSRLGRFPSLDPLMIQNPTWSPYSYALDNPVMFVDENGEWPGITFMYFEVEAGLGIGYGLNYIAQSGIAWDEVGKTHFKLVSAIYIVNQNLEESSRNPQLALGASGGASGGITQNWSKNTFSEFVGGSASGISVPTGKPGVKAKFGLGLGFNSESFTLSFGLQAGFKVTKLSTSVEQSISLTDAQADIVNDVTDVVTEKWILNNVDYKTETKQWTGTVATRNTKGELIDTGIQVSSTNVTGEKGENAPSGVWTSQSYRTEAAEAE